MGPSVKFVLAIINAFSNKKRGVNFFGNRTNQRGGPVLEIKQHGYHGRRTKELGIQKGGGTKVLMRGPNKRALNMLNRE